MGLVGGEGDVSRHRAQVKEAEAGEVADRNRGRGREGGAKRSG